MKDVSRVLISKYDLEDFVEKTLIARFGKPVVWGEHNWFGDLKVLVYEYEDEIMDHELYEDDWEE
jgi:hypothetical protein